ncbi:hypothetical protein M8J75_015564 [Diaphorina citri]|nr:hypothetical protein M8J75_015564 [Diaphorina citri]
MSSIGSGQHPTGPAGPSRKRWSCEENVNIFKAFFRATRCGTDVVRYRKKFFMEWKKIYPDSTVTEQRICDQKYQMEKKNKFLNKVQIDRIKQEVALELGMTLLHGGDEEPELENTPLLEPNQTREEVEVNRDENHSQPPVDVEPEQEVDQDIESIFNTLYVKYKDVEPKSRQTVPRVRYDRMTETKVKQVDQFLKIKMPIFHSLEHINLIVYVAALTVCALLNIKAPDEHSTSQPSRNVKPNWQIRLEKKIAFYRSDLTKLFNWKANKSKKYIPLLWKYGMNPKHHHFNHKFSYVTDNLKQKIAAFSQRLRRYNKSFKRTSENKMFSRNEKQFYQKLERPANPMYDGLPNKEEVVNYWKTLWSNTTEHKKDSSWIEDERHNYDHVNPMTSSDVTLDDILHLV